MPSFVLFGQLFLRQYCYLSVSILKAMFVSFLNIFGVDFLFWIYFWPIDFLISFTSFPKNESYHLISFHLLTKLTKTKNSINQKLTVTSKIQSSRQKTGRTDYQCVFCLKLINLPLKLWSGLHRKWKIPGRYFHDT